MWARVVMAGPLAIDLAFHGRGAALAMEFGAKKKKSIPASYHRCSEQRDGLLEAAPVQNACQNRAATQRRTKGASRRKRRRKDRGW